MKHPFNSIMLRHVKSLRPTWASVLHVKELSLISLAEEIARLSMAAIKIENSSRVELPTAIHFGYFDISKREICVTVPEQKLPSLHLTCTQREEIIEIDRLSPFWFFYQTVDLENVTTSILKILLRKEDNGKSLTCRAVNTRLEASAMEDVLRLDVQCKCFYYYYIEPDAEFSLLCLQWKQSHQ